jgi:hypothetical protein
MGHTRVGRLDAARAVAAGRVDVGDRVVHDPQVGTEEPDSVEVVAGGVPDGVVLHREVGALQPDPRRCAPHRGEPSDRDLIGVDGDAADRGAPVTKHLDRPPGRTGLGDVQPGLAQVSGDTHPRTGFRLAQRELQRGRLDHPCGAVRRQRLRLGAPRRPRRRSGTRVSRPTGAAGKHAQQERHGQSAVHRPSPRPRLSPAIRHELRSRSSAEQLTAHQRDRSHSRPNARIRAYDGY